MGKCSNAIGLLLGGCALAAHIASIPLGWYPTNELGQILRDGGNLNLQVRILPIIAVVILTITCIILIIDFKADKIVLRCTCIFLFLAAGGVIAYCGGWFIYQMVVLAINGSEDPNIDTSNLSQELIDALEEFTNANGGGFIDWWNSLTGVQWDALGLQAGPFVAIAAAVLDTVCAFFYSCVSCCGCN